METRNKQMLNLITPEVMATLEIGLGVAFVTFVGAMTTYCIVKKDFRF